MGKLVDLNGLHATTVDFPLQVVDIETSSAGDLSEHDPDVMNIRFKLVYEGVNNNGDRFTESELRKSFGSLKNKLINWEHDEPNIGVITDARIVEATEKDPLHIVCEGVIMSWRYPDKSDMVKASAEMEMLGLEGAVATSMECYFHDADYIIGDYEQVIPMSQDTGELAFMRGRKLGGKLVSRELKGMWFGGAAITENPAEKRARLMAVASNKRVSDGEELFTGLRETDFALSSLRMFPLDTREHVTTSLQYFDSIAAQIVRTDNNNQAQVEEAHFKLLATAKELGVDCGSHECFLCHSDGRNQSTDDPDCEIEESEANRMAEDETKELEVEEPEAAEEEAPEEAPEEELETEEEAAEDEPAEESPEGEAEDEEVPAEEAAEEAAEEEAEKAPDTEAAGEFDVQAALVEIREMLSRVLQLDVSASSDSATDEELRAENAALRSEKEAVEASLCGLMRLQKLSKAGITFDEDEDEKSKFLASLDEAAWTSYFKDICKASKSSAKKEKTDIDDIELNLEDEQTPENYNEYKSFWG